MALISYRRHRSPPSIIQHAIWLYLRFTLSYRDVEDLLAERGLDISYETVRRWVLKFERQQAEVRFARDSPLEEAGFEPSVPRDTTNLSMSSSRHPGRGACYWSRSERSSICGMSGEDRQAWRVRRAEP